jgi:hypothetical protein
MTQPWFTRNAITTIAKTLLAFANGDFTLINQDKIKHTVTAVLFKISLLCFLLFYTSHNQDNIYHTFNIVLRISVKAKPPRQNPIQHNTELAQSICSQSMYTVFGLNIFYFHPGEIGFAVRYESSP